MGDVGSAIGNQITRHFFVELTSFIMSLLDGAADCGQWKSILFTQQLCLCTTHVFKDLFDTG